MVLLLPLLVQMAPSPAVAAVPPAAGDNAVITVQVGSDRTGTSGVTTLACVVLGLFATAADTTPVSGFGTCTSDSGGDCSFTVPETQAGGANRDARFFVKQISAPSDYYANQTLGVGTTVANTDYAFQTGAELRSGVTYRSTADFMIATANTNDVASGGIWQASRINPVLPSTCGLKVAIVADLSNSVTSQDLTALKSAASTTVNALVGTPSTVSLFTFASAAPAAGSFNVNRPALTSVSDAAGAATVNGWINGWTLPGGADGGTNWDRAFAAVAQESQRYDVVVVITDGNPTYFGDPVQGPGNRTRFREVENAIFSANALKAEGTRVIAMGVGTGVAGVADNLRAVSGLTLGSDYFQASDYSDAAAALEALAHGGCNGTVTVVKQVQPPGTAAGSTAGGVPTGGWAFKASASPSTVTIAPTSGQTASGTGALNFDLTYPDGTSTAAVTLTETQQSGYTLNQIGGQNAVCIRVDTGASLPVTNADTLTEFTITASTDYPVSCTVYNIAPQAQAQMVVDKVWSVNGKTYANGAQPSELTAQLTLGGTAQDWGAPRTGLPVGSAISINESTSIASSSLCTITGQTLTDDAGTTVASSLPYSAALAAGSNSYHLTSTVICPARLTLLKSVLNGPALPTAWTLTATAPSGALAGPSGLSGVTAPVTPLVTYPMAESTGDPRYVQLTSPGAVAVPGSTTSWFCTQVNPTTGAVIPGFSDGLNGGVTVPLGFAVKCEARNQTAELRLIKQVINDDGGTKLPSDWTLTATPIAPPTVPAGLVPQSVTGSTTGQVIAIRPGQPYALTESTLPGYTTSLTCATESDPTPRPATSITLGAGESGVCTFVNDDVGSARLTLVKTVTNDNGGTALPTAWTLAAGGPTPVSGVSGSGAVTGALVSAGVYTLSESGGPAGYVGGAWLCTGATVSASTVTVPAGGSVVCTVNNDVELPRFGGHVVVVVMMPRVDLGR